MPLNVTYNDEFDKENYPLSPAHLERLEKVAKKFGVPPQTQWFYHATIHGQIFWFHYEEKPDRKSVV